jgi:transketolase
VVALDGEVANSTYSELFGHAHPERFVEAHIAERDRQVMSASRGGDHFLPPGGLFDSIDLGHAWTFDELFEGAHDTAIWCGEVTGHHAGLLVDHGGPFVGELAGERFSCRG